MDPEYQSRHSYGPNGENFIKSFSAFFLERVDHSFSKRNVSKAKFIAFFPRHAHSSGEGDERLTFFCPVCRQGDLQGREALK